MKHLSASDKAKLQFGIQEHEQYVFIFPPTYNKQKAIKFTSEISTFEIENTFVSQALPLGLLLVWALMQVHTLKTAQHHSFVCRLLWWDAAICSTGAGSALLLGVHQMCHECWMGAGLNKFTFSEHTEDLTKNYPFFFSLFFRSSEQCKVHKGHRGQFICQMEILESKKTL